MQQFSLEELTQVTHTINTVKKAVDLGNTIQEKEYIFNICSSYFLNEEGIDIPQTMFFEIIFENNTVLDILDMTDSSLDEGFSDGFELGKKLGDQVATVLGAATGALASLFQHAYQRGMILTDMLKGIKHKMMTTGCWAATNNTHINTLLQNAQQQIGKNDMNLMAFEKLTLAIKEAMIARLTDTDESHKSTIIKGSQKCVQAHMENILSLYNMFSEEWKLAKTSNNKSSDTEASIITNTTEKQVSLLQDATTKKFTATLSNTSSPIEKSITLHKNTSVARSTGDGASFKFVGKVDTNTLVSVGGQLNLKRTESPNLSCYMIGRDRKSDIFTNTTDSIITALTEAFNSIDDALEKNKNSSSPISEESMKSSIMAVLSTKLGKTYSQTKGNRISYALTPNKANTISVIFKSDIETLIHNMISDNGANRAIEKATDFEKGLEDDNGISKFSETVSIYSISFEMGGGISSNEQMDIAELRVAKKYMDKLVVYVTAIHDGMQQAFDSEEVINSPLYNVHFVEPRMTKAKKALNIIRKLAYHIILLSKTNIKQ